MSAWARETGDFVMRSVSALADLSRQGRASWVRLSLATPTLTSRVLLTQAVAASAPALHSVLPTNWRVWNWHVWNWQVGSLLGYLLARMCPEPQNGRAG